MSISTTYTVSGMTCEHCVKAVTEELQNLDGVSDVAIDLVAGGDSPVRVTSSSALDRGVVRDAVDEAGYVLADER
jgi:copper chaperone